MTIIIKREINYLPLLIIFINHRTVLDSEAFLEFELEFFCEYLFVVV